MASIKSMKRDVKEFDAAEFFTQPPEDMAAGKKVVFLIRRFTVLERGQINTILAEDATPERRDAAVQRCSEIRIKAQDVADLDERQKLLDTATVEQQISISKEAIKKLNTNALMSGVLESPIDEGWTQETIDEIERLNQPLFDGLLNAIREFNSPPVTGNSKS